MQSRYAAAQGRPGPREFKLEGFGVLHLRDPGEQRACPNAKKYGGNMLVGAHNNMVLVQK